MKLKLPDNVSSQQDLADLLLEVQEYARWFAHESIKKRVVTKYATDSPLKSPAVAEILRCWEDDKPINRQSLDSLIETLKTYKDTAPSLTITLAAPVTSGLKLTLVAWCRMNIAPNILVTFQFSTTLLGGMIVRYKSHVFDWSFRRAILARHTEFPEVLRHV